MISATDLKSQISPIAAGTLAINACRNKIMRFYAKAGTKLPPP